MRRRSAIIGVVMLTLGTAGLRALSWLSPATWGARLHSARAPIAAGETQALDPVTVVIDAGAQHQSLYGFGSYQSALWLAGPLGDTLGPLRGEALDAAYGQVRLTTGQLDARLLESPGDYSQRRNDNDDPLTINWQGFQTDAVDATKRLLLDQTRQYGFNDYYVEQNVNIRWDSPWLAALRRSNYNRYLDEVSEQIAAGALYWRDRYGIVTQYFMPFNEPTTGDGLLAGGTDQEVLDIVKRAGARLHALGFADTKFVLPNEETTGATYRVSRLILEDPEARQYAGAIGYHPYPYDSVYTNIRKLLSTSGAGKPDPTAVGERARLRELANQYGVPLFMTEVSNGGMNALSYDEFRGRAIHIRDELVYADASAYLAMQNIWDMTHQVSHHQNQNLFTEDGAVVLVDNPARRLHITGLGYAIGHYARWLSKGAIRIEAISSDPLVQVVAFNDQGQPRVVLVAINNDSTARSVDVSLAGLQSGGDVTGEQSTPDAYWQPVTLGLPDAASGFLVTLPARSVTTFAVSIAEP